MAHTPAAAALFTGLLLLMSVSRVASELSSPNCGFAIENGSLGLLLFSCPQLHLPSIPAKVWTHFGITLTPVGATLKLENVTAVALEIPVNIPNLPVQIKQCGLSALQQLPSVANAQQLLLNLSDLGLRLGGENEFVGIGRVAWLDLSNNRIIEVPSGSFKGLSELLVLDLSSNLIDFLSNDSFCGLSMLRVLDIRDNPMVMTFALVQLPSLESLDTSMSVVEVGVFCRMNNLKRVVLHRPLTQLQCFVFDSLPNLKELSFSYFSGTNQICFTMMCDPHPVLNKRVPFNFTVSQLGSDGSVAKTRKNAVLTRFTSLMIYLKVCLENYERYYKHHDNGMPLTTGCLQFENFSPRCSSDSFSGRSSLLCRLPTHSSTTPPSSRYSVARSLSNLPTKDKSTCDEQQSHRLTEMEALTVHQARVLITLYAAIGTLLLCVLLLAGGFLLKHYNERRRLLARQQQQRQQQLLLPPLEGVAASEALQMNGKGSLIR